MAVTLYRQVGKGKSRRYQKVNLGRGRRPADLTGPYFLRYSLADGTRPWEHVGDDLDEAIAARERKQAYCEALDANVPVVQDQDDLGRTKITDAVYQWFAELQLFQGKDQQGKSEKTLRAYNYRLGFFLDFTAQNDLRYLDQIDRKQLLRYVKFLREHESDLDDRTVHNVFETLNTFLRTRDRNSSRFLWPWMRKRNCFTACSSTLVCVMPRCRTPNTATSTGRNARCT